MSERRDVQIIPPARLPDVHQSHGIAQPPTVNPGGVIESALTRWEAVRHTRVIRAITTRTHAQSDLFRAQTHALGSYIERERALQEVRELSDILAADRERRRLDRSEEYRRRQHQYELSEANRMTEMARAEAVLFNAQEALATQRALTDMTHELARKRMASDLLDADLNLAERHAVLRAHSADDRHSPTQEPRAGADGSNLEEALYQARSQLLAHGLDTSAIDAVLDTRKAHR